MLAAVSVSAQATQILGVVEVSRYLLAVVTPGLVDLEYAQRFYGIWNWWRH